MSSLVAYRRMTEAEGRPIAGTRLWQRNYFERVIRTEEEWNAVRDYIVRNPAEWSRDPENPAATE